MCLRILILLHLSTLPFYGQQVPPSPDKAWPVQPDPRFQAELARTRAPGAALDPNKAYTLAELVDVAERTNPDTRVVWERAKARAAAVGVANSALFPTIAAMASASINQYSLFYGKFYHEDTTLFPATLNLSYTVLDFGARSARIDAAKANLLAADFTFNDAHRRIIFNVAQGYYQLLDALGQEDAAQATLKDAQTVQEAIEAKLANGLATLPDVLEARAATAQARYELASIRGLEESARGALATAMGVSPAVVFRVQDVSKMPTAESIEEPVQTVMERALEQRPDLLAQVAQLRATDAEGQRARSANYPTLSFSGYWGHTNAFGQQKGDPPARSAIYPYQAQLSLSWTVFDGGARHNEIARTESERRAAQSQVVSGRNEIENEIWTSYTNLKTAQQQQEAADALLEAASQSYTSATEAFRAGVRTFIDVTTAQRDLARARTAQVTARVRLLESIADLAFRAADPIPAAQH
jgi:outer membrane protein TolC